MFESEFPAKRGTCSSNAKNIRMKVTVENVFRAESSWYSNDFIWLSCDLYFFFFFAHVQDTLTLYNIYERVCLYEESDELISWTTACCSCRSPFVAWLINKRVGELSK